MAAFLKPSAPIVGSRKAEEQKAPLSEIIEILNERFGTNFTDEDRLFFEQITEKATHAPEVIRLRQGNPFDKLQLALRQLPEELMIRRIIGIALRNSVVVAEIIRSLVVVGVVFSRESL